MIEDYEMLSEEELLEDIIQEIEEETDIDLKNLDLNFEGGKLMIQGSLANEDELEYLVGVLENHIDPGGYELEVELLEGHSDLIRKTPFVPGEEAESDLSLDKEYEDEENEGLDFVEEDNYEDDDQNDKW